MGGAEFLANATCQYAVASTVVSSTQLLCLTPPLAVGTYAFEVTNNAQDYTALDTEFLVYGTAISLPSSCSECVQLTLCLSQMLRRRRRTFRWPAPPAVVLW